MATYYRKRGAKKLPPHNLKGEYTNRAKNDVGSRFTPDEIEFMLAMERYMREKGRPFPDARRVDCRREAGVREKAIGAPYRSYGIGRSYCL